MNSVVDNVWDSVHASMGQCQVDPLPTTLSIPVSDSVKSCPIPHSHLLSKANIVGFPFSLFTSS